MRLSFASLVFVLITFTTPPAFAESRHCDAGYLWETTGGTFGGWLDGFSARGSCPAINPNKCRTQAKSRAVRCMRTQWENRWSHHPFNRDGTQDDGYTRDAPEACLAAAEIKGYDLTRTCVQERKDGHDPAAICHDGVHPTNVKKQKVVATRGDVKSALETQVCCFFREGKYQFQNNASVHVRLVAITNSGNDPQKKCSSRRTLTDDYVIDCNRVRAQVCN
ncbi:hypothetical protein [Roseovarius aestuariivivens]|uniref:hypothetical protein n=1 Tax=Roseovarius aestuariivivens TaxID=1888910 RepID=UPI001080D126|nr:hypothetical protein [Roseovarius aestuariivivens]